MKIVFDHELDSLGNIIATHVIDTADSVVQTMLAALKGNVAAQALAGYGINTKMVAYFGQTRWQAILGEIVRVNDTVARALLGV